MVDYLHEFVADFDPPLHCGVEVQAVEKDGESNKYRVETDAGDNEASNVVVTTGTFQRPRIPEGSSDVSSVVAQFTPASIAIRLRCRPVRYS